MLKDLAPQAVQRKKQNVEWSKRTHSFGSEVEETSETPLTEKPNEKNWKQMMTKQ